MNDLGVSYDKGNKCWYAFYSNEKIDKNYFLQITPKNKKH